MWEEHSIYIYIYIYIYIFVGNADIKLKDHAELERKNHDVSNAFYSKFSLKQIVFFSTVRKTVRSYNVSLQKNNSNCIKLISTQRQIGSHVTVR